MTTQLINNEGEATLTLCGRLDTAVSSQVSADINQLLATAGTIQHLTVDAGQLEYISSSGLRILQSTMRTVVRSLGGQMKLTHVCDDIFDVLKMTGFNRHITIERA